jgi:hypothetical protein
MTVGNSEGERRCDEKCYGASGGKCGCVCGGMNHGKGLSVAMQNVEMNAKNLLAEIKKKNPEMRGIVNDIQLSIWGD